MGAPERHTVCTLRPIRRRGWTQLQFLTGEPLLFDRRLLSDNDVVTLDERTYKRHSRDGEFEPGQIHSSEVIFLLAGHRAFFKMLEGYFYRSMCRAATLRTLVAAQSKSDHAHRFFPEAELEEDKAERLLIYTETLTIYTETLTPLTYAISDPPAVAFVLNLPAGIRFAERAPG